jgi:acylphosphatase
MNERLEATISGRVQMVMYRDFTARFARRLGLVGEVRNMRDGTVRVVAEGPREKLELLLPRLRRGSFLSDVQSVSIAWLAATGGYNSFDIAYD